MGLVLGMQGVGVLIADVPAGILIERTSRKSSMLIGAAVVGLSTLGVGLAHTVLELVIYQLIAGIGSALWSIARYTYLDGCCPNRRAWQIACNVRGSESDRYFF